MILKDLTGFYYVYDYRTKSHGQEYLLEILETANDKIEFIFHNIVSGNLGSSGIIWKGSVTLRDHQLFLKALEKKDWRFTAIQEGKEENIQKVSHLFNFHILKNDSNIFLISDFYEKPIKLVKLNKTINKTQLYSIVYWIVNEIIKLNELNSDSLEYEPSRFWRISNLFLISYNEIKSNEQLVIEIIFEYDLEFVKEEKRVIENDEILAEHRVDKVFFNEKFKIIKHDSLK